jgi:hypothetical protein
MDIYEELGVTTYINANEWYTSEVVEACKNMVPPHCRIGRPMKVGREAMKDKKSWWPGG